VKVGDLITWRKPNRRGERDPKGYGLIISAEMMGQPSNLRLWLIVKWSNGKTERATVAFGFQGKGDK
jgi:hypothetical protein